MRIGITERGDAGLDYSWVKQIRDGVVDGAILITKQLDDKFIDTVLDTYDVFNNIIIHCTCTGLGGTKIEPNVIPFTECLNNLERLLKSGIPKRNCVLRIDPILPNTPGLTRVIRVLNYAIECGVLPHMRVRVSVLDEYKHVKKRFTDAGYGTLYCSQYPSSSQLESVSSLLAKYPTITFETCAEPYLTGSNIVHVGCVSETDLDIFGLNLPDNISNYVHTSACY